MTQVTVPQLERSMHETNVWLHDLTAMGKFEDEKQAYTMFRAVLHALRDKLNNDEAVHLSAQLPTMLRGVYFEGWHPAKSRRSERSKKDFIAMVKSELSNQAEDTIDLEAATSAVFMFLHEKLSEGESRHVESQLPTKLKNFWNGREKISA